MGITLPGRVAHHTHLHELTEREIDALVAQSIFGQHVEYRAIVEIDGYTLPCDDFVVVDEHETFQEHVAFYTRFLSDAWLIIEKLGVSFIGGLYPSVEKDGPPLCHASFASLPEQVASSLPVSIVWAALHLLGIVDQHGTFLVPPFDQQEDHQQRLQAIAEMAHIAQDAGVYD